MKKTQSRLEGFSNLPGAVVATGKVSKLLISALGEGRKSLAIAIRERKNSPASCVLRHRYSNEGSIENHQLHELGEIEEMVTSYQAQQRVCTPKDILAELGYVGKNSQYGVGLINLLVAERVILLDASSKGYVMSNSRTDKPVLMGGKQEVPSYRF